MASSFEGEDAGVEKAYLISVQLSETPEEEALESIEELVALTRTAGAMVVGTLHQKRSGYDPSTVIGSGKLEEARREIKRLGADLVIFDNDVSSSQQAKLEEALGTRVIDRKALILDIFAQHAHTREGRTQVELAQLSYLLPRIRGRGIELSRLGGGIGTRGPGETKLEVDRRRIRKRIRKLERELSHMEAVRLIQRKKRTKVGLPAATLVGYTNSGKSSLLNRITGASVLVEDRLFSTLDSTTRKVMLPGGQMAVISDTVGFIRKLPHELVAAFRSTLETVRDADLLIHVVDGSRTELIAERIQVVNELLSELGALELPRILVLNKSDLLSSREREELLKRYPDSMLLSAKTGEGIPVLLERIESVVSQSRKYVLCIPIQREDLISDISSGHKVLDARLDGESIEITVRMTPREAFRYKAFVKDPLKRTIQS